MTATRQLGLAWLAIGGLCLGGCTETALAPSGTISRVWFDNRTHQDVRPEVLVAHADLTVTGQQDRQCGVTVRYFDAGGLPLRSRDRRYRLSPGEQVGAMRTFVSHEATSSHEDFDVGVPYEQLELPPGSHRVIVQLELTSLRTGRTLSRVRSEVDLRTDGIRGEVVRPRRPTSPHRIAAVDPPATQAGSAPPSAVIDTAQPEPPRPTAVYWFMERYRPRTAEHGLLVGPFESREAAEAHRRGRRDRAIARTGRDPIWSFACTASEDGRGRRVVGPFGAFRMAEEARRRLRRLRANAHLTFGDIGRSTVGQVAKTTAVSP